MVDIFHQDSGIFSEANLCRIESPSLPLQISPETRQFHPNSIQLYKHIQFVTTQEKGMIHNHDVIFFFVISSIMLNDTRKNCMVIIIENRKLFVNVSLPHLSFRGFSNPPNSDFHREIH